MRTNEPEQFKSNTTERYLPNYIKYKRFVTEVQKPSYNQDDYEKPNAKTCIKTMALSIAATSIILSFLLRIIRYASQIQFQLPNMMPEDWLLVTAVISFMPYLCVKLYEMYSEKDSEKDENQKAKPKRRKKK